jgi:hypothetical protein
MKKLWPVLALALAIVVALPAQSSARHTLQHRVKVLEKKTRALQGKVNCLRRTGAATFLGYAFYEGRLTRAVARIPSTLKRPTSPTPSRPRTSRRL